MTIDDLDPIDSVGGMTPRSSFGERGIIALALLALVGGLFIAGGNFIGKVMPSPSTPLIGEASPTATPSPTPEPTQQIVTLGMDPLPTPDPNQLPDNGYYGWIRAIGVVPTRSFEGEGAAPAAPLADGDVAYANSDSSNPGWMSIDTSTGTVWLEPAVAQSKRIERIQSAVIPYSGGIWSMAAGAGGFLAQVGFPATALGGGATGLVYSPDGITWRLTDFPAAYADVFAWGPAGWLATSSSRSFNEAFVEIFRSTDGMHWERLAAASGGLANAQPGRLVGSANGYLMQTYGRRFDSNSAVWTSIDGLTWGTVPGMLPTGDATGMAGVASGFYVWSQRSALEGASFSADGEHWTAVTGGPSGDQVQVVQVGNRLIGMAPEASTRSTRIYVGSIDGSAFAWDDPGGRHFGALDPTVSAPVIASDGHTAVIIAFDWGTSTVLEWTSSDGLIWMPVSHPANPFGGSPTMMAGGNGGIVLVGERPTLRGQNPIFWHRAGSGAWAPEPQPLMDVVPNPSPGTCARPLRTAVDLQTLDLIAELVCFGDTPMTLTGWSINSGGFSSDGAPGFFDPAWLAAPSSNQLSISPINVDYGTRVVLSPALDPAMYSTWRSGKVRITGHFDDSAAYGCRWLPDPSGQSWYSGPQEVIDHCRTQFVVTAVQVIDGA